MTDRSRVPFIVRYPKKIKPNTTVNALINLNDIMPTLLEIAGTQYPAPFELAGKSVFDLNNRNETFIEHGKEARRWVSVVTTDYKYAYYYGGAREELFDLINDPKERINVLDDHLSEFDDIRKQLRSKCIDWELRFGLEDHIENHDFKQWPQPQLRPFMGTGELIFPKRIMDPVERAKIQPLREQIVNVVKDEPVLRLKDLDFSYMLKTNQLTEEDIAWIIEQDNINKEGK
jgi:arylsulfatase